MLTFTTESNRLYLNGQLYAHALSSKKANLLASTLNTALAAKRAQTAMQRVRALSACSAQFAHSPQPDEVPA